MAGFIQAILRFFHGLMGSPREAPQTPEPPSVVRISESPSVPETTPENGRPMRLSEHFTFQELTTTAQPGMLEDNREEALGYVSSLRRVAVELLEPIRERFGPIRVNSGFRGPALNAAIGGSQTSQHMRAEAADITPFKATIQEVFEWLWKEADVKCGQVILERGCLHVSLPTLDENGRVHDEVIENGRRLYPQVGWQKWTGKS